MTNSQTTFDFKRILAADVPAAEARWSGFPPFNFVGGHNDPASLPVAQLRQACEAAMDKQGAHLASYYLHSGPQGYIGLREYLVKKLKKYSSIECSADDLLLTSGSLQAMDLINAALLNSGDTVIVEQSNYGGALSRFYKLGVHVVPIPVDADGMQMEALEQALLSLAARGIKPKFIYSIPTVHNPTGSILTLPRRHTLLALAEQYDLVIWEDECYADLLWSGERPASLYALNGGRRVVHIGSFSKSVAPALRVGYVLGHWSLLGRLLALKTDAGSGALEQVVLAEFCERHFDTHLQKLNTALEAKLDTLTQSLDEYFGTAAEYRRPAGGIFLWVRLPEQVNTSALERVAIDAGIAVNPGSQWSHQQSDAQRWIRLCFASLAADDIRAGVEKLAQLCHDHFGVPAYIANRGTVL